MAKLWWEGELLVTLTGANIQFFADVSDEMLLREIVIMDVGEVKRAPSPQYHYGTDVLKGNKFFVLEGITPDKLIKNVWFIIPLYCL